MNEFLDKRDFMAELEEFEKHLLRSGITTQGEDGALAELPPLVARREDACQSVVEPQGPRPVEARRNDGDPAKSETFQKLGSVQRVDFAAIEAELKHARRDAARAEPLVTATSNAIPSLADELKSQRHGAETVVSDPVGVADQRAALATFALCRGGDRCGRACRPRAGQCFLERRFQSARRLVDRRRGWIGQTAVTGRDQRRRPCPAGVHA